jgi:hypothetical protein
LAIGDGGSLELPEATFAVLGNTRPGTPILDKGRSMEGSQSSTVIGDVIAQTMLGKMDFVVHTGDMVTQSSLGSWLGFGEQFAALLDGSTPSRSAARRLPIIPVAGDRDCAKEPTCGSFADVFPGFGVEIGYGRVATWQSFTVQAGTGKAWTVLVLDSNKKGLGSRWNEQIAWLAGQVKQPGQGILLFVHDPAVSLTSEKRSVNTTELIEVIETHAPLLSIRAIFSSGPHLSQAFLSDGAFGIAHIGAGGGGAPAMALERGVRGAKGPSTLAKAFDAGIDKLVESYQALPEAPSARLVDEAQGTGSFKGYPRVVSAASFPTHGWWKVHLKDGRIGLDWRALQPDGTFAKQAGWGWSEGDGWVTAP